MSVPLTPRSSQAYEGQVRKLVLVIDMGETSTGISYSFLVPGKVPTLEVVRSNRNADHKLGKIYADSRIPNIVYYDRLGKIRAVGRNPEIVDRAAEESWMIAERFNLFLICNTLSTSSSSENPDIPPLPPGKSLIVVLADFFRYLFKTTMDYLDNSTDQGRFLMDGTIEFVLTHPVLYGIEQQCLIRNAFVLGGLVPNNHAAEVYISFVPDSTTILRSFVERGVLETSIENGHGIMFVDCGRYTTNIDAYVREGDSLCLKDHPQCIWTGLSAVKNRANTFINDVLQDTEYAQYTDRIVEHFVKNITKCLQGNGQVYHRIRFADFDTNDPALNIHSGQFRILSLDVISFFEPTISKIVEAILNLKRRSECKKWSVVLSSKLAWVEEIYKRIKLRLQYFGIEVSRRHMSYSVIDRAGALSHHLASMDPTIEERLRKRNDKWSDSRHIDDRIDPAFINAAPLPTNIEQQPQSPDSAHHRAMLSAGNISLFDSVLNQIEGDYHRTETAVLGGANSNAQSGSGQEPPGDGTSPLPDQPQHHASEYLKNQLSGNPPETPVNDLSVVGSTLNSVKGSYNHYSFQGNNVEAPYSRHEFSRSGGGPAADDSGDIQAPPDTPGSSDPMHSTYNHVDGQYNHYSVSLENPAGSLGSSPTQEKATGVNADAAQTPHNPLQNGASSRNDGTVSLENLQIPLDFPAITEEDAWVDMDSDTVQLPPTTLQNGERHLDTISALDDEINTFFTALAEGDDVFRQDHSTLFAGAVGRLAQIFLRHAVTPSSDRNN